MRFDREFLKKLNILFVENNENIKKIFSENLDELFKKVFFVSTVFDALVLLDKTKNSDEKIDLILSESYFADLNVVEFLSKVRKEHKNIPFIFILEDMDKQLLLNVLKYDITNCFIKPINEIDILEKIEKACLLKQEEDKIINYQNEIEEYLSLINKVAIVFMFNPNTTIFYVNDFFKELIKYDEEYLMGKDYRSFFHYDTQKNLLEEQSKILLSGEKWQGNVKFLTAIDTVFYTSCIIIPIFDENKEITKYISINFLTSKDENAKKEFKQRVLFDLKETKRIYTAAQRKIDELNGILESCNDFDVLKSILENEQKINEEKYSELDLLKDKINEEEKRYKLLTLGVDKKLSELSSNISDMKTIQEKVNTKMLQIIDEIKEKDSLILKIEDEIKYLENKKGH